MKKLFIFFAIFCALCSALGAQVYYEGQGGKNLGTIRVSEIKSTGLSSDEAELLPLIPLMMNNDFATYANMNVPDDASPRNTVTGTITKTAGRYYLAFTIMDNNTGLAKPGYSIQCTLDELQSLSVIKTASESLITGMGVKLTPAGKEALYKISTRDAAIITLAKSVGATGWEKMLYTYQASNSDPTLAEAARRVAAYQTEIYKAPEISLAMPDIRIPEIRMPEFKAPEIRIEANPNIGDNARKQLADYSAQDEASRLRQESGNRAMKELQDGFLAQFKVQAESVKKQQADLMGQRNILLGQQKTLLARQRQIIAQLRETENSYDTFFTEHPPFEIIYDPMAAQVGNQNLQKGTINLQFPIASFGTNAVQVIPLMLADFEKGLGTVLHGLQDINGEFDKVQTLLAQVETAGGNALAQLVKDYAVQIARVQAAEKDYADQLARLDTVLKTDGYAQLGQKYAVQPDTRYAERLSREYAVQPARYNAVTDKTLGDTWSLAKWNKNERRTFAIEARLENDKGKTIGTAAVILTNQTLAAEYTQPMSDSKLCVFQDVPVNDITDTLKVSIQRVNNRNVTVAANAGYIKISPLEADGYTKDGLNIDGYGRDGFNSYGYDRLGYNKAGYDRRGYNKAGYDKNGFNRNGRNRLGQTRQEVEKEKAEADRKVWWEEHHSGIFPWVSYIGYNFSPGCPKGFRLGLFGLYAALSEGDGMTLGYAFNIIDFWLIIPVGFGFHDAPDLPRAPVIEVGYEVLFYALSVYGTYRLIDFKEHSFSFGVGVGFFNSKSWKEEKEWVKSSR